MTNGKYPGFKGLNLFKIIIVQNHQIFENDGCH